MVPLLEHATGLFKSRLNCHGPQLEYPAGIALDQPGGKIYWADLATDAIHSANLDGSNVEELVTLDSSVLPNALALDLGAGKMYWTSKWGSIWRVNLDGTYLQMVVDDGGAEFHGVALDPGTGKMYWCQHRGEPGAIRRGNLDGSGTEDVVTGLDYPWGIALDLAAGKMYWTNYVDHGGADRIQRANLDGSNVEDIIVMEVGNTCDIALALTGPIPTISEWGLMAMGLLVLAAGTTVLMRRQRVRAH
jgi:low density lipoprotein receptor-related protein 5/6